MILRRFMQHIKEQNWFAVGLDVIVVIVGIFLGMQVTEWNESRQNRIEEKVILQRLQHDLRLDIEQMTAEINRKNNMIADYIYCLDVLAEKVVATKAEFDEKFKTILLIGYIKQNTTTFNDLQTSGRFTLIENDTLSQGIVNYYHTEIEGWFSADRDYTRSIVAPYLLEFDYAPQGYAEGLSDELLAFRRNISDYVKPTKSLDAYKSNYFVINVLRAKMFTLEGQVYEMENLVSEARSLNNMIEEHLKTI